MDAWCFQDWKGCNNMHGSREKYKVTVGPDTEDTHLCPRRDGVGSIASVKPLGLHSLAKAWTRVLSCRGSVTFLE